MVKISDKTELVLHKAGWTEGREIDVSSDVTMLKNKGYQIFDEVTTFLSEFSNLNLSFTNDIGAELFVSFDIEWSLSQSGLYENELIQEDYPRAIGCKMLTLVGRQNRDTCLAMNEGGMIYSLYDGYILEVGKGIDAIDNLVTKSYKDRKQVPMPEWWGD